MFSKTLLSVAILQNITFIFVFTLSTFLIFKVFHFSRRENEVITASKPFETINLLDSVLSHKNVSMGREDFKEARKKRNKNIDFSKIELIERH